MAIRIGIIGVGRIGIQHADRLCHMSEYELTGAYDTDIHRLDKAKEILDIQAYDDVELLIQESDAIAVCTPANTHVEYARKVLMAGKHLFIEKPITESLSEAEMLYALAREANVIVQIGHIERFNPVLKSAKDIIFNPMFIECHRLAPYDPRGTEVSVVLDLMIHDIDIVLQWVKNNIKNVSANGVAVISKVPDIANARIEFDNGCVANITASRIAMQKMRKIRVFQKNAYISLDMLNHETSLMHLTDEEHGMPLVLNDRVKYIHQENLAIEEYDAIKTEWQAFSNSILHDSPVAVSLESGLKTMDVAQRIIDKIQKNGYFH